MAHCYYPLSRRSGNGAARSTTISRYTSGSTSRRQSSRTHGTVRCGTMPRGFSCWKRSSVRPSSMPMGGRFGASDRRAARARSLGAIPSFADWARLITPQAWMLRGHPLDGTERVTIDTEVLKR